MSGSESAGGRGDPDGRDRAARAEARRDARLLHGAARVPRGRRLPRRLPLGGGDLRPRAARPPGARGGRGAGVLRLLCDDPAAIADGLLELVAPNGTRVELAAWNAPLVVPDCDRRSC